jgi:hypothetical protein
MVESNYYLRITLGKHFILLLLVLFSKKMKSFGPAIFADSSSSHISAKEYIISEMIAPWS